VCRMCSATGHVKIRLEEGEPTTARVSEGFIVRLADRMTSIQCEIRLAP
jgi:hypothetical protein